MDLMTAVVLLGALGVVGLFVYTIYTSPHTMNVPQAMMPIMPVMTGLGGMGPDVEMEPAKVTPVPKPPTLKLDPEELPLPVSKRGKKKKANFASMNHHRYAVSSF